MIRTMLLLFMLLSSLVNAQSISYYSEDKSVLNDTIFVGKPVNTVSEFRHGLSANAGSAIFFSSAGIGYECLLVSTSNLRLYAGAGGAFSAVIFFGISKGAFGFLDAHLVVGNRNNQFETAIGAFLYADLSYQSYSNNGSTFRGISTVLPLFRLGYRYQRPGTRFYFRTGIGFPDMLYVGFGGSFGKINK
jgi:hypothetical protein